jgi:exonuclease SbcC
MKILHVTDTHGTAKNPTGRLDIFYIAVLKKFMELSEVIKREKIDLVIHTGDLLHTPRVSLKFAGKLSEIMKSWGVPVYIVPGNHDIDGYTIDTIDQTILGFMAKNETVKLLTRGDFVTYTVTGKTGNNYTVMIEGQEYYDDIDTGKNNDYDMTFASADFNILGVHGMLLDRPYFPDIPHTLIKDVATNAHVVLCGHYHPGFTEVKQGDTWFFNPGSGLRVEASKHNETAMPKYLIFEVDENTAGNGLELSNWKYGHFTVAQPGPQVFDFTVKQEQKTKKKNLINFKQSIKQALALQNSTTIVDIVQAVAQLANAAPDVVAEAMNYINTAKVNNIDILPEIKGYLEKPQKIWLTKAIIKNFQSHKNTVVDFVNGFNVIAGESNKGKTSILRAILWCIFNDPKGTDFIMTGEDICSVELQFSDGSVIVRERTTKSAGSYKVTHADGTYTEYSGFNNEIPIQVINEHQMPEVYITKDIKSRLNVAAQLDPAFLLSESPQVKAAAVGRIIGTQVVDSAIKNLSRDILGYNKKVKDLNTQIDGWNKELEAYDDLDLIKEYIDTFEAMLSTRSQIENELNEVSDLYSLHNGYQIQRNQIKNILGSLPDIDKYIPEIESALDVQSEIEELYSLMTQLEEIRVSIDDTEVYLNTLPDDKVMEDVISDIESRINEIELVYNFRQERAVVYKQILALKQTISRQDTSELEAVISDTLNDAENLTMLCELAEELNKIVHDKSDILNNGSELDSKFNSVQQSISVCENRIVELVGDTCPFCGNELNEEHLEHVIAS